MAKRGPGRPPIKPALRLTERLVLYVSPGEMRDLVRCAAAERTALGIYARMALRLGREQLARRHRAA